MNKKLVTLDLFGKMLDRLIEMVVLGKAHLQIGRGLGLALHDDPAIGHVAPTFWGMTLRAHLDIAQLNAFKLFDTQHGTMTIEHLLEMAEQLKGSFPNGTPTTVEAVISIARSQIDYLRSSHLKKIAARRNRVLAHADPTIATDPEKLTKAVQLTFSDLNIAFNSAGSILNDFSVKLRDTSPVYEMLGGDDYRSVLDLVVDAKCAQIREYEAKYGPWQADYMRPKKCPQP